MTADNSLLIAAGEALWGSRWQAEAARYLNVSTNTVQHWRRGRFRVPPGVYDELLTLVRERVPFLREIERKLKRVAEHEAA